jgi:predicted outer membrane protein
MPAAIRRITHVQESFMRGVLGVAALTLALAAMGCQKSDMDRSRSENDGRGEQRTDQRRNMENPSTGDRDFMADAAAGGAFEVQASDIALRKSSDGRVRSIAQRMVDDHSKANNQLMDLAKRKGGTMPPTMTTDQEKMIARLNNLQGSDFDREYLQQQEKAHRDAIAKFKHEAKNGSDPDLRNFAAQTLPTLEEHQRMVSGQSGAGSRMGMEK